MYRSRVVAAVMLALAGAAGVFAANASAHVTVSAPGATRGGGDQEITFRVPVEKHVDTVGLTVALPTDTPIADVLVRPIAGWTHSQRTTRLPKPIVTDDGTITTAVSQITWKASPGHGLHPGEYGSFTVIAGQLPDAPSITFRALQTYADGSVVSWNQVAAPGSTVAPEDPAPVLDLAPGGSTEGHPTAAAGSDTTLAVTLSVIALVLAVGALGVAVFSRPPPRGAAMRTQWAALLAAAITAVLGTAGILRAASSAPSHTNAPTPIHRRMPMHMPGMHMTHGAAGAQTRERSSDVVVQRRLPTRV